MVRIRMAVIRIMRVWCENLFMDCFLCFSDVFSGVSLRINRGTLKRDSLLFLFSLGVREET